MQSSPDPFSESQASHPASGKISSNLLLGMATAPVICFLTGGKLLGELLIGISQSSEEIFRGDRLPLLHFPQATFEED
ncbi:MAG: hypothetical protein ACRC8A_10910 [Microcoleaceae cyanobacterium]